MSVRLALTILVASLAAYAEASPFIPGEPQKQPIALVGGTIHPVEGPTIERGTLLFDKGKIVAVGKDVKLPPGTETIDVRGKHVYPGMFDANTQVGLLEISAVRATRDTRETGTINPNVKALVAVNPDSEIIPVARSGGVLTVLTAPTGGLISGVSAVIHLDGWTYEDMSVSAAAGLHVHWPRRPRIVPEAKVAKERNERRQRDLDAISEAFADARAYAKAQVAAKQAGTAAKHDSRWEAMLPVLAGRVPVIVHADAVDQIQAAVAFAVQENVRLIILGGYDSPLCAELLKKHKVPVIVEGVHRLPQRRDDAYDAPFTLPQRLREAGVAFCIAGNDRLGNERNLPYDAATAAAHGLPRDAALRSVTLAPAEILGVADRIGSLVPGKEATLIVTDGDLLEITTRVERAYITGRRVDLTDKQKLLWKKYREKYRRLRAKPPS